MRGVFICIKSVSLWLGYVGQIINLPRKLEVFDASGPVTSPLPLSRAPVWQGPHHSARSRPRPCSGPGAPASSQPGSPGSLPSPSSVASSLHKALPGLSHDHRAVSVLQAPMPALPCPSVKPRSRLSPSHLEHLFVSDGALRQLPSRTARPVPAPGTRLLPAWPPSSGPWPPAAALTGCP